MFVSAVPASPSSNAVINHEGYEKVGNLQLSRLMGGDARLDPSEFGIEHKTTLAKLQKELEEAGQKPYYIPAGASDHPLGGLGFARWAFEVEAQEKEQGVFFDTIIVCAVTGSTFAGMIAGFKLAQKNGSRSRKIIGVDASAKVQQTFDQVLRIAKSTAAKIGLSEDDVTEADVILDPRYHAGTYGIPGTLAKSYRALIVAGSKLILFLFLFCRRANNRGHQVWSEHRSIHHGPRVRGQEPCWHDGHDQERGNRRGKQCVVCASGRPACPERVLDHTLKG